MYKDFFATFKPTEEYEGYQLVTLFKFARKIRADMQWLCYLQDPISVVIQPGWIYHDNANIVAEVLTE